MKPECPGCVIEPSLSRLRRLKNKMEQKTYTEIEVLKILDEFFEDEDKILRKIDGKIMHLLVSRSINFNDERKELEVRRKELKQKFLTPQGFKEALDKSRLRGKKF